MASQDHNNLLNILTPSLSFLDRSQVPAAAVVSQPQEETHLVATRTDVDPKTISRRSADFTPCFWSNDFVQSLRSDYMGEIYTKRAEELKEDVRRKFDEVTSHPGSSFSLLKLIDTVQRLGLSYHYANEIKCALDTVVSTEENDVLEVNEDIYTRALKFRLLRQHGYEVSHQDIFKSFKEGMGSSSGDWKPSILEDVEGLLSLYEASFYAFEGEELLDESQIFTSRLLREYLLNEGINNTSTRGTSNHSNVKQLISQALALQEKLIRHALEIPLHWRLPRIEARWFIDAHENMPEQLDRRLLLEFAKLDFNIVQAKYQEELKYASRWWNELGLTKVLSYARDRLVENFFWSLLGYSCDPKLGHFRIAMTKLTCLLAAFDDTYDIYGTLEELELFTGVIERWDSTMEGLPDYMRVLFLAVYNTTNETAYEILKKHGRDVLPYMKNAWADICNAYLVEAKWYYSGYIPTFEEHINNGWLSGGGCFFTTFFYCLLGNEIKEEPLECLKNHSSNLVRWSFILMRLLNELANSDELARGDTPASIQCYMNQAGVSESIAREYIKHLIRDLWKKINKNRFAHSIFPPSFVDTVLDMTRVCHFYYQYGDENEDWYSEPDRKIRNWIISVVLEPVPTEEQTVSEASNGLSLN